MQHDLGGAFEQTDLGGEVDAAHEMGRQQHALTKFFDRLGDFIEGAGQPFDVLALERGDECGIDRRGNLGGNLAVLAAGMGEFVEDDRLIEGFAQSDEGLDAVAGLFGAGLQQAEEFIFFA